MSPALSRRQWLGRVGGAAAVGGLGQYVGTARAHQGQGKTRDVLFVANRQSGTVSLVAIPEFRTLKTIDVTPNGKRPAPTDDPRQRAAYPVTTAGFGENFAEHVAVTPDGETMYVSRAHTKGDVVAFDVATEELLWDVNVAGERADHMTLSDDGRLFVSAMTDNTVQVIDPETPGIVGSFPAKSYPHGVHLSHHDGTHTIDGQTHEGRFVVSGSLGNMVVDDGPQEDESEDARRADRHHHLTVADAETLEPVATFEFSEGLRPFTLTEDDRRIFLQRSYFHGFVEFDLERGRPRRTVHLPVSEEWADRPRDDYPSEAAHHGIQLSPDGNYVCAAGMVDGYVALVSRPDLRVDTIIDVGGRPGWATNGPHGNYCFVADRENGVVSVISYRQQAEVARIDVEEDPAVMTVAQLPQHVLEE